MPNPLTQLNRFFDAATEQTLSGSDQLIYLHLFNKFNRAHWTETISVRDAELLELCRLYDTNGKPSSINIIRNAKSRLKAKGFIDFTAGKGNKPTEYRLIPLHPVDTPVDTPADTPVDTSANSYIRVREDVPDVKTLSSSSARARASEPTGVDELADFWTELQGGRLTFEHLSELERLIDRHGVDWVKAAMREASDANGNRYGLSFKLFRAVVNRRLKPKEVKANGYRYHAPTDDFDFAAD